MSISGIRQFLLTLAAVSLGFAASTATAQHRGGGGHGGHGHGGGHSGHSHSGHSHSGHSHHGHSHHGHSHSHRGHSHYGHSYHGHSGHRHSGIGFGISIGGGYPFGYGGYGYGGLGYRSYGLGYSYPYSSGFSPYYYSGRSILGPGYYTYPSYSYAPTDRYSSSYRYVAPVPSYRDSGAYSAQQPVDEATSDLRPGMILPDGSTVISVGPAGAVVPDEARKVPTEMQDVPTKPEAGPPDVDPVPDGEESSIEL